MQGGRDPFFGFGDPFGRFGGFGGERGLMSSFFGGRDPFDDPFFTRPFGSMFESNFFGSNGGPFMNPNTFGFLEHQPNQPNRSRGPVIEELSSDDEECEKKSEQEIEDNPRKHGRSGKEPFVEYPDDEIAGSGSSGQHRVNRGGGGWAIPSIERSNNRNGSLKPPHVGQRTGHLPRTRQEASINPDLNDGIGSAQFRSNGTGSSNQRNRF